MYTSYSVINKYTFFDECVRLYYKDNLEWFAIINSKIKMNKQVQHDKRTKKLSGWGIRCSY